MQTNMEQVIFVRIRSDYTPTFRVHIQRMESSPLEHLTKINQVRFLNSQFHHYVINAHWYVASTLLRPKLITTHSNSLIDHRHLKVVLYSSSQTMKIQLYLALPLKKLTILCPTAALMSISVTDIRYSSFGISIFKYLKSMDKQNQPVFFQKPM